MGVEYDLKYATRAQEAVDAAGLGDRITVRHANVLDVSIADATAAFVYLVPKGMKLVAPALRELIERGGRVVTYVFSIPGYGFSDVEILKGTKIYRYGSNKPEPPALPPSSSPPPAAAVAAADKKKQLWVFLLAGQSNMAGRGRVEELPPHDDDYDDDDEGSSSAGGGGHGSGGGGGGGGGVLRFSAGGVWEEVGRGGKGKDGGGGGDAASVSPRFVSHADVDLRKADRCGVGPADAFAATLLRRLAGPAAPSASASPSSTSCNLQITSCTM